MPTVIIFGANGQDGCYLTDLYKKIGYEVIGVSRPCDSLQGDISSFEKVREIVCRYKPDLIFHLAAESTTRHDALFANHATISTGTLNILEAVYRWHPHCKVFLAGSGLQFVNTGAPIKESDPFEAHNAYSVERIHSVYAARYFRSLGIRVYVGYLFHHESPLRKLGHVSQNIVQAVKRIASGSSEILKLGDISVEKEWAFAGDIAEGMALMVKQEAIFEAVIGTGITHTIEDWLRTCFTSVHLDWKDHVELLDGFTPEYKRLVSNPETMHSLGWHARVGLIELAGLMLES